jgi:hypothetical protein|eukprot:CAMPEP_0169091432 /NCGR_PEP_ID=MMETSP1015-20121227/16359_1 /TAXON_ID=342587 /ORGANISM="Karlodinium micrum, Strain CCMP2283" /LENGTH=217 /DNA_ID=CAMNT_0009151923 /DNA_START=63 /DNA_END=716 /DNA_ORIENTATION=+
MAEALLVGVCGWAATKVAGLFTKKNMQMVKELTEQENDKFEYYKTESVKDMRLVPKEFAEETLAEFKSLIMDEVGKFDQGTREGLDQLEKFNPATAARALKGDRQVAVFEYYDRNGACAYGKIAWAASDDVVQCYVNVKIAKFKLKAGMWQKGIRMFGVKQALPKWIQESVTLRTQMEMLQSVKEDAPPEAQQQADQIPDMTVVLSIEGEPSETTAA